MLQIADALRRRGAQDRGSTLVECPCGHIMEILPDGRVLGQGHKDGICNCGHPIKDCPPYQSPYTE